MRTCVCVCVCVCVCDCLLCVVHGVMSHLLQYIQVSHVTHVTWLTRSLYLHNVRHDSCTIDVRDERRLCAVWMYRVTPQLLQYI